MRLTGLVRVALSTSPTNYERKAAALKREIRHFHVAFVQLPNEFQATNGVTERFGGRLGLRRVEQVYCSLSDKNKLYNIDFSLLTGSTGLQWISSSS